MVSIVSTPKGIKAPEDRSRTSDIITRAIDRELEAQLHPGHSRLRLDWKWPIPRGLANPGPDSFNTFVEDEHIGDRPVVDSDLLSKIVAQLLEEISRDPIFDHTCIEALRSMAEDHQLSHATRLKKILLDPERPSR